MSGIGGELGGGEGQRQRQRMRAQKERMEVNSRMGKKEILCTGKVGDGRSVRSTCLCNLPGHGATCRTKLDNVQFLGTAGLHTTTGLRTTLQRLYDHRAITHYVLCILSPTRPRTPPVRSHSFVCHPRFTACLPRVASQSPTPSTAEQIHFTCWSASRPPF
jgi:hypothetical protein